jgi:hypothetical protein
MRAGEAQITTRLARPRGGEPGEIASRQASKYSRAGGDDREARPQPPLRGKNLWLLRDLCCAILPLFLAASGYPHEISAIHFHLPQVVRDVASSHLPHNETDSMNYKFGAGDGKRRL